MQPHLARTITEDSILSFASALSFSNDIFTSRAGVLRFLLPLLLFPSKLFLALLLQFYHAQEPRQLLLQLLLFGGRSGL